MSQTAAAPPPPSAAQATTPTPTPWAAPTGQPAGQALVDTPRLLNRWQLIGMSIAIVFGLASALIQFLSWQADGRAADDTAQLVRVQEIQTSLLRADALATNTFLQGGLEDPDQRQEYDATIASVLQQIADAAEAQPADREALAALNVEVNEYTGAVEQGRVYNRQGLPVGGEYLSGASAALRADALPILGNLVDANAERADGALGGQHPVWLLALGIAALAGLWWINRGLAQHFRRVVNVGVAIAALIVLAVTAISALAAYRGASQNDGLRDDELAAAVDQAAARTAANDAKANESLGLIKRGSGAVYRDPWNDAAAIVEAKADARTLDEWGEYVKGHDAILVLDDKDLWKQAVGRAISTADESSTWWFDRFDTESAEYIDENATATTDSLRAGRTLALLFSGVTLVLGFGAAVAVARGISERRKEYA